MSPSTSGDRWRDSDTIDGLTELLQGTRVSERKLRLFALECVRAISDQLRDVRSVRVFEFVEANVERSFKKLRGLQRAETAAREVFDAAMAARQQAQQARQQAQQDDMFHPDEWIKVDIACESAYAVYELLMWPAIRAAISGAGCVAHVIACLATPPYRPGPQPEPHPGEVARARQQALHVAWLRDIFGNPFLPVAFDPTWRSDTAVSLARVMYETRDFTAMPILADALQDAGCEHADILDHCRESGPHVRGCWVVDLVLGRA